MGIEPTSTAWEAVVLPMNYGRKCLFIFYQLGYVCKYFSKLQYEIEHF